MPLGARVAWWAGTVQQTLFQVVHGEEQHPQGRQQHERDDDHNDASLDMTTVCGCPQSPLSMGGRT